MKMYLKELRIDLNSIIFDDCEIPIQKIINSQHLLSRIIIPGSAALLSSPFCTLILSSFLSATASGYHN
jgi:hypothetical protein